MKSKQKTLDQCFKKALIYWPLWFHNYIFDYGDGEVSEKTKDTISFICAKLDFGYKDVYSSAFVPSVVMGGKRSTLYEDLIDSDFSTIEGIVGATNNSFLLAKCHEVLFIKTQNRNHCDLAADYFLKSADLFISSGKVFASLDFIKHSLFLLKSTKSSAKITSIVDKYVFSATYKKVEDRIRVINCVFDFLANCHYAKYDKKKLVDYSEALSIDDSDSGLELIKNLIDYYSSMHDEIKQNDWRNKYADMCEALCKSISPRGYRYIDLAINTLSKQASLNEERINGLRFQLEEEQKRFFDTFQFQSVPIEGDVNKEIYGFLKRFSDSVNKEGDSIRKFARFLEAFSPVKERELVGFTDALEDSSINLFTTVVFGHDKRVVDEIGPSDVDKRNKQNIVQAYSLFHSIYSRVAAIYLNSVKVDSELEKLIAQIIAHNEFVPNDRIGIVKDNLIKGLNKNIRGSVYKLISQFEYGCVNYLKNKKNLYPVITKGGMTVTIDLNHILTCAKFRDRIVDVLGEDLTKELQYLLVEKRYGNLRNQNYHEGYDREDVFTNIELLVFFRLINAYCLGYDEQINR